MALRIALSQEPEEKPLKKKKKLSNAEDAFEARHSFVSGLSLSQLRAL